MSLCFVCIVVIRPGDTKEKWQSRAHSTGTWTQRVNNTRGSYRYSNNRPIEMHTGLINNANESAREWDDDHRRAARSGARARVMHASHSSTYIYRRLLEMKRIIRERADVSSTSKKKNERACHTSSSTEATARGHWISISFIGILIQLIYFVSFEKVFLFNIS